jgi:hypothetical protein
LDREWLLAEGGGEQEHGVYGVGRLEQGEVGGWGECSERVG